MTITKEMLQRDLAKLEAALEDAKRTAQDKVNEAGAQLEQVKAQAHQFVGVALGKVEAVRGQIAMIEELEAKEKESLEKAKAEELARFQSIPAASMDMAEAHPRVLSARETRSARAANA